MMHAEICPVCSGTGKYKGNNCHGCNGKGWVQVGIDFPVLPLQQEPNYPFLPIVYCEAK